MRQFSDRFFLDLPYSLPADPKRIGYFLQRFAFAAVDPVSHFNYLSCPLIKAIGELIKYLFNNGGI